MSFTFHLEHAIPQDTRFTERATVLINGPSIRDSKVLCPRILIVIMYRFRKGTKLVESDAEVRFVPDGTVGAEINAPLWALTKDTRSSNGKKMEFSEIITITFLDAKVEIKPFGVGVDFSAPHIVAHVEVSGELNPATNIINANARLISANKK